MPRLNRHWRYKLNHDRREARGSVSNVRDARSEAKRAYPAASRRASGGMPDARGNWPNLTALEHILCERSEVMVTSRLCDCGAPLQCFDAEAATHCGRRFSLMGRFGRCPVPVQ